MQTGPLDPPRTTIHIVDDDERLCRALRQALENAGYRVVVSSNPEKAQETARESQPDLMLCDIRMPALDGFGVLRTLQADPTTAHLPVIFMTGSMSEADKVRAFRFGVVDYLEKPLKSQILMDAIKRLLHELPKRKGVVGARGVEASASLVRDVETAGRTGFLTLRDGEKESRQVVQAGHALPVKRDQAAGPATEAEFEEMNLFREQVLTPSELAGSPEGPQIPAAIPAAFRKVLVAEDDNSFRFYLSGLLRDAGFEVIEAADGQDALDRAKECRPWLILSDVEMPRLDGFDLCHALRAHPLLSGIPVILLSGWDDVRIRIRGLGAGADDYLSKTSPGREVVARVVMMLSRYAGFGAKPDGPSNIEGRLAVLGTAGLLQMCNITQLTGVLNVRGEDGEARFHFEKGEIVDAMARGFDGADAVYDFLRWETGRFRFDNGVAPQTRSVFVGFEHLLLEGVRRLDELTRRA